MAARQLKVLYVCPFAHDLASYSFMAFYESNALSQAGVKVELLTFRGLLDEIRVKITQHTVKQHITLAAPIYHFANLLRKWQYTRMFGKLLEYTLTLMVAIRLKRKFKYDVIHLREGDPFLFILHLLNSPLRGYSWSVILIGAELAANSSHLASLWKNPKQFFSAAFIRIMNSSLWRPFYTRSLARNNFVYLTENEAVRHIFELYMQGIFAGRVFCLPLGVNKIDRPISREEARRYLGIPLNKPVFLCFGSPHAGKDWETLYIALKDIPDVLLLHGGDQRLDDRGVSLQLPNSVDLTVRYNMQNRVIIKDHYISEEEKPNYFFAADAIILSYTRQFLSNASSLWEACRFEIPVLISDNEQFMAVMEKYKPGLVFKAGDPNSMKETTLRFLNLSEADRLAFRRNCRKFKENFSIDRWAEGCIAIYKKYLLHN